VIVIIGILATISFDSYENIAWKAYDTEAKQMLRAIGDSMWRFRIETGRWPTGFDELDVQPPKTADGQWGTQNHFYQFLNGVTLGTWPRYQSINVFKAGRTCNFFLQFGKADPYVLAPGFCEGPVEKIKMDDEWYMYHYRFVVKKTGGLITVMNWSYSN
jgi:type II secretory pathway pseudopilin PulG